jgi:hypothetical protein
MVKIKFNIKSVPNRVLLWMQCLCYFQFQASMAAALEELRAEHEEEKEAFVTAWQAEVAALSEALLSAKAQLVSAVGGEEVSRTRRIYCNKL